MNRRQLEKLGVPPHCVPQAITAVQDLSKSGKWKGNDLKRQLQLVVEQPDQFLGDPLCGDFARTLLAERDDVRPAPVAYRTWGAAGIDAAAQLQMQQACSVPLATYGALMPDAHVGYGLPIGGVLAVDNAVIPYAVGVDIACRMKLSVMDMPPSTLSGKFKLFQNALERGTRFGVGVEHEIPRDHAVMDQDWAITRITRENKDRARKQLGTSGSGNHFVEFGVLTLPQHDPDLGLDAGEYVALLSHSGSRGVGAAVCSTYSNVARAQLPAKYADLAYLSWLSLDSDEGQAYWAAMNLMGDYAAANHDVIHQLVSKLLGAKIIGGVENHHNFAWKETHFGREMVVHRKGATPASLGELGVIPGSMADPAYVVRGKGHPESLRSASHGAGRQISRKQALSKFNWRATKKELEQRGIHVLSAGADEVPGVYKNIDDVMREQADLVEIVARFDPKIVKMCDDGSRAED